jgi:carboxyl-terminal processing protease
MPDFFVPIDTSEITDLYRNTVQNGSFTSFPLTYVDKNRDELHKKYETEDQFIANFNVDKKLMDEFFAYVKKENKDFEFKEDQYKISKSIMELRLKATIANDLFGIEAFYKIYNQKNEILQKAIQLLQSNEYDKQKLALN